MSTLYSAVEGSLFLLGVTSLLTWTHTDSASRDGVDARVWTVSALFLPAVIWYVVFVRTRHPRREVPTKFEHSALSLAMAILGWTLVEWAYFASVPRNATVAGISVVSIGLVSVILYASLGVFRPRKPPSASNWNGGVQ